MKASNRRVSSLERRVSELEDVIGFLLSGVVESAFSEDLQLGQRVHQPQADALPQQVVAMWAAGKVASIGKDSEQASEDTPF